MTEWKPIPSFPDYEASRSGDVRSVPHTTTYEWKGRRVSARFKGRVLKQRQDNVGYMRISIRGANVLVHRLVLEAFDGACPEDMECRHLNGDKTDNRLENLQWGTRLENAADTRRLGREHYQRGEDHYAARLTEAQVVALRWDAACGEQTKSIAQRLGVTRAHISAILRGRAWKHVGGPRIYAHGDFGDRLVECDCGGTHAGIEWPTVRYDHHVRRSLGWAVEPGTLATLERSTGIPRGHAERSWCLHGQGGRVYFDALPVGLDDSARVALGYRSTPALAGVTDPAEALRLIAESL